MGKQKRNVPQKRGMNALGRVRANLEDLYEAKQRFMVDFLLQAGCDAFILAAADVFDLGEEKANEAVASYREYIMQMMDALIEDSKDDDELVYFWTDLDRRLKQIVGDELFVPHDERYDETGLRIFGDLCKRTIAKILNAKTVHAESQSAAEEKA